MHKSGWQLPAIYTLCQHTLWLHSVASAPVGPTLCRLHSLARRRCRSDHGDEQDSRLAGTHHRCRDGRPSGSSTLSATHSVSTHSVSTHSVAPLCGPTLWRLILWRVGGVDLIMEASRTAAWRIRSCLHREAAPTIVWQLHSECNTLCVNTLCGSTMWPHSVS